MLKFSLTLSWRRPTSYRNQSIDLQSKLMNWFLYDISLRHERVKFLFDLTCTFNETRTDFILKWSFHFLEAQVFTQSFQQNYFGIDIKTQYYTTQKKADIRFNCCCVIFHYSWYLDQQKIIFLHEVKIFKFMHKRRYRFANSNQKYRNCVRVLSFICLTYVLFKQKNIN